MNRGAPPGPALGQALASPADKQRYVRRLFSTIADRYDLITVLLSFGMDRSWKRRAVDLSGAAPGRRALDLACGTGDLAFGLASRGASVVGLDVTHRMLQLARRKSSSWSRNLHSASRIPNPASRTPLFVTGDMGALPFADAQFDLVTTGYGLRNVPDLALALGEIRRVLRPGGTLVSLDFNRPEHAFVRAIYLGYLRIVGGAIGWSLHRDPDTYRYIPASIERYPGAAGVVGMLTAEGFERAEWHRVLGGLMALHVARK